MTSLAALATELEARPPKEDDIEKAAKGTLRRLAEQGEIWLLVYDNVASPADIADLLPAAGARVLITSPVTAMAAWCSVRGRHRPARSASLPYRPANAGETYLVHAARGIRI